jgi:hypothetical protein
MRLPFLVLTLGLMVLCGACKSSCRQLAEKLCDCAQTSADRNVCLTQAANSDANAVVSAEQDQGCRELLPQCNCRLIDTRAGKERCGLARRNEGAQ